MGKKSATKRGSSSPGGTLATDENEVNTAVSSHKYQFISWTLRQSQKHDKSTRQYEIKCGGSFHT